MSEFTARYKNLNANQKKAVDSIDGPVMVVAGPGTGKTELLSVRVANILDKTDTLPQNILCLTFTDNAADNMRQRLISLLGTDAHKVAVHTFHSFGSEVINQHGEYFYEGSKFQPADDLATVAILTELLEKLPHGNVLASTMNDQFTYLHDIKTSISDLKRAGLTPDELEHILQRNDAFIAWVAPKLNDVFSLPVSKKILPQVQGLLSTIEQYTEEPYDLVTYMPLHRLVEQSLRTALVFCETDNSTKPLTAWKKAYIEKDVHSQPTLRDTKRSQKLHALVRLYDDYLRVMQERELYDYDDMILKVIHAMEMSDELRFSLQEAYQYLLIDEFQDTNDAQMRLVWNLTNHPVHEGRPNIMVVGDDDQAIYRFQGANLSNILDFRTRYRDVSVVTLTDNYRSQPDILSLARSVIVQGSERLEVAHPDINKTLTPHHHATNGLVVLREFEMPSEELHGLATSIAEDVARNPTASRAVIARNHRHLVQLLPHLTAAGIAVSYERQDDALDSEPVKQLELLAHIIDDITTESFDTLNADIAQLLSHPAWRIPPIDLWKLSLEAVQSKKFWLECMLNQESHLRQIGEWLIMMSQRSRTEPLEYMIDTLFGTSRVLTPDDTADPVMELFADTSPDTFVSPLYTYFFGPNAFDQQPDRYLSFLTALQKTRSKLREYRPGETLLLSDFVDFIQLHRELDIAIRTNRHIETGVNTVALLSAHKAKGLEFDTVYILHAQETVWGNSARNRGRLLQFPSNLPITPTGDTDDERLRLLYVALTRAKNQLILTTARVDESGKQLLPVGTLPTAQLARDVISPFAVEDALETAQTDWRAPLLTLPHTDQQYLLKPLLHTYKLSATHLNAFLDVARGGPEHFLLHNLLRFPEAMSASAVYGSAIHTVLQRTHQHLAATGKKRPVEDVLHDFESVLKDHAMSPLEREKYTERGIQVLEIFLRERYDSFRPQQLVEQNFSHQHVYIDTAHITGALDLIDIDKDEKTIFVTDYKTGKAVRQWQGKTDYEKIKLHHYEQQLMFYKLLIEHSRQFSGYTVTGARIEFVEPDDRGSIVLLDYIYEVEKLATFERLIGAVWERIQTLNFTVPEGIDRTLDSIKAFENTLISGI